MTKEKKVGIKISDKTANGIILSFFAAFSTCFFIPFDLYVANAKEISIPTPFIIAVIAAVSVLVFVVSLLLLRLTKGRVNFICSTLIFAVTLACYIQSNFLSIGMGLLNGEQYAPGAAKVILNALFWAALIFAVFVLHKKKEKMYDKAAPYLSAAIILIEIITVSVSSVTAVINGAGIGGLTERYKNDITQAMCTTENINTYSTEKNIIMILVDSYDSLNFDAAMEAHPETLSEFDGFTYYTNTVGMYQWTEASMAYIFTHNRLGTEQPYSNDRFFKSMSENYSVNLYSFIFDRDIFAKYADNYILVDYSQIKVGAKELAQVGKTFYKAAMFKAMPEGVKQYFWVNSDSFNQIISTDDKYSSYSYDNLDFLSYLADEPVLTDEKQFKFIYLNGIHSPLNVTADLERAENWTVSIEDSSVAVNKILNIYLHMLKQGDGEVYDNSEILILADHGMQKGGWVEFPMIMFKPARAESSGITVSYAPLSYEDLYPTLLKLSGEEPEERTIFDIGEDEQRTRYFEAHSKDMTSEFTGNIK